MQAIALSTLLLAASLALPAHPPAGAGPAAGTGAAPEASAPPGMVLVKGGRTQVGTDVKDIERLLEEHAELQAFVAPFLSETPRHRVEIEDFYLMVTEVTNEQFAEFVRTTGAKPPQHWGEAALTAAREAFLEEQGKARKAALDAGETPPARVAFEPVQWWNANWKGKEWKIPAGAERKPVVFVDYGSAEDYASWAGLRLMTEFEYQRAVRGDGDAPYPWGDEWKAGEYAATQEVRGVSEIFEVGKFPAGVSRQGVFDLAGNVWEWTSSKFTPFDGFKHRKITIGRGAKQVTFDSPPPWNPNRRVVVGGSIQNPRYMARCTTRAGTERSQQTSATGFRCAASTDPGADVAGRVLDAVPSNIRPSDSELGPVTYAAEQTLALDRWKSRTVEGAPPGYAVIEGYEYLLFVPVEEIYATNLADLRKHSIEDNLVHLGILSVIQDVVEPALPAGTYQVAVRGEGKARRRARAVDAGAGEEGQEGGEAPPAEAPPAPADDLAATLGLDIEQDNLVFFDMTGAPALAVPVEKIEYSNPTPGEVEVVDREITITVGEGDEAEQQQITQQWLEFRPFIKGRTRKGVQLTIGLRFDDGVLAGEWRKR